MISTIEYIFIIVISLFFIKIFIYFYKKKYEKHDYTTKKDETIYPSPNLTVDIICDITNNFGKYYAKEAIKKKNIICIIPVYKTYNKEYENVDKLNEFVAEFFKFLDMKNGKLILASENNCVNNYLENIPEDEDNDEILLASCIMNKNLSIIVCVINYDKDTENQLDIYLKNKKKNIFYSIINNLFLYNINELSDENIEPIEKKFSLTTSSEYNYLLEFFDFMNVKKEFLLDLYSIMQINTKNFSYFYKLLGNVNSGTFLNPHIYDNFMYSNIYNSIMDIYYNLICEKVKKDKKKIHVGKFYTFCCLKCDYKNIVKWNLMKLENNSFCYFSNIYSYFCFQFILYFSKKNYL